MLLVLFYSCNLHSCTAMSRYLCIVCMECSGNGDRCSYCAGCKGPWYCSAECQKLHWKHDNAVMLGWPAHSKQCWFIAVRDKLCEFLPDALAIWILAWANRSGPKFSQEKNRKRKKKNEMRANLTGTDGNALEIPALADDLISQLLAQ